MEFNCPPGQPTRIVGYSFASHFLQQERAEHSVQAILDISGRG